jgi:hypothetical protein
VFPSLRALHLRGSSTLPLIELFVTTVPHCLCYSDLGEEDRDGEEGA